MWQFYAHRRHAALRAKPNRGHLALAALARRHPDFLTLTQNVDGLSARAGHDDDKLLCLHGDLFTLKCTSFSCSYVQINNYDDPLTPALDCEAPPPPLQVDKSISGNDSNTGITDESSTTAPESAFFFGGPAPRSKRKIYHPNDSRNHSSSSSNSINSSKIDEPPLKAIAIDQLPLCPSCRVGLLRPGVVWFGEPLPFSVVKKADDFISTQPPVDLILVIGTSGSVWPAAGYVEQVKMRGGKVAVFNIDRDAQSSSLEDWMFEGDAAETLPIALEPIIGQLRPPRRY